MTSYMGFPQLKLTRRHVTVALVIVNLVLALYTIPALVTIDNRQDDHVADSEVNMMKRQLAAAAGPPVVDMSGGEHEYFYVHQAREGCPEEEPFLLIAVCSAAHHFDLREAIRLTWASVIHRHKLSTKLVFFLGAPSGEYEHVQPHVADESRRFGDVVQEDFVDSYGNLTVKTIAVLKWSLNFCSGVKFLMKTDDDVFLNVSNLVTTLIDLLTRRPRAPERFMLGHVIKNARPFTDRSSKWYAPTPLFKGHTYPDYLSGSAYIITGSAVDDLFYAATTRRTFWLEDIFLTGMLSRDLEIPLLHMDKFVYRKPKTMHSCLLRAIISAHELSADELRQMWHNMHNMDSGACPDYIQPSISKLLS